MTKEEALTAIRSVAESGEVQFVGDTVAAKYDVEIQDIFVALRIAIDGELPYRPLWASDESTIGHTLDYDENGLTLESRDALLKVSNLLGVLLSHSDLYYEAAMRLRVVRMQRAGLVGD